MQNSTIDCEQPNNYPSYYILLELPTAGMSGSCEHRGYMCTVLICSLVMKARIETLSVFNNLNSWFVLHREVGREDNLLFHVNSLACKGLVCIRASSPL